MRGLVRTATLDGVEAIAVDVEADVGRGLPGFTIVGMADAAVREARDRVRSAIRAVGLDFPNARVVVNLAPAPLPKRGTGFDLPIAASILSATGQIPADVLAERALVGELSLDGSVRPVTGLLAHAVAATRDGLAVVGPRDGASAAARHASYGYHPIETLGQLKTGSPALDTCQHQVTPPSPAEDLAHVIGNPVAKRALEICAAGSHNLVLEGPPGVGKTLLARCLCGVLPPMREGECLGTALVHSVAGLDETVPLGGARPFRAPHHAATKAGLVGGGRPPRPGEASLAHNGVLFLDEMNEFAPSVLQTLRQPLEDGSISLVRADGVVTFPARFTLVGALNPCPCGYAGDPTRPCECSPAALSAHRSRIGGPLMDRIDLGVRIDRIDLAHLATGPDGESSADVRLRVVAARAFARDRGDGTPQRPLSGRALFESCGLTSAGRALLEQTARTRALSGRGVTRVLRVSRSIADLDAQARVDEGHVLEALSYRPWDHR